MDLNKVMLIGNVTRDPEKRATPQGTSVVSFSVATNFRWTDQSGQPQERAEFHNVVAWRKLADIIGQYVHKGSKIYIEGRLQTRSWDDPSGVKKYRTEVIADSMIMLDRVGNGPAPTSAQVPVQDAFDQTPGAKEEEEIKVEDIPF